MRNTIKAVLLSVLVFPGVGHFSLKKPVQGTLLLGITAICFYYLFTMVLEISHSMSGKIENGEIPYDTEKVTQIVTEKLSTGDYQFASVAVILLIVCWIFGVIDSFRIGRSLDKKNTSRKSF